MNYEDLYIVLQVRAGSHAYGTALPSSDLDIRGICLPPPGYLIGLGRFEQYESSMPDMVLYGLHKFARLALQANPNILELLWVDPEDILLMDECGLSLIENRHKFLSKRVYRTFGGYAKSQLYKLIHKKGYTPDGSCSTCVEPYGYDTKNAMHMVRLFRMGVEALSTGCLQIRRPDAAELLEIRNGKYTLSEIKEMADELDRALADAYSRSSLPDEPDSRVIGELVTHMTWRYLSRHFRYG